MTDSISEPIVPRAPHGGPRGGEEDQKLRVDASTNVNAYGPAPVVAAAAAGAEIARLPDPLALAPRRAAAERWERPLDELAFGAGTSELLLAAALALLRRDDVVLLASPIYGEYARSARLVGGRPIAVRRSDTGAWPGPLVTAVRATGARLVVMSAPGNPLGDAYSRDLLREVAAAARHAGAVFLLDQSYDAFLDAPFGGPALPGHPAVLHLRSLTKDHAIPGLRAGFACGPRGLIERLESARVPWSASSPAQAAAVASFLPEAEAHVAQTVRLLRRDARNLAARLREQRIRASATDVHWILCNLECARTVAESLEWNHGVRVRPLADHGLPDLVRIAAGLPSDNQTVLAALTHRPSAPDAGSEVYP